MPYSALAKRIELLLSRLGTGASWLCPTIVLTATLTVVLRYGFNIGIIALQEAIVWMHAAVIMLGAAFTLQRKGHVRVDILYRKLSPTGQRRINITGHLLFLFPFCLFLGWVSLDYFWESWQVMERSTESDGLPALYILKALIPLFALTLMLQGIAEICRGAAHSDPPEAVDPLPPLT